MGPTMDRQSEHLTKLQISTALGQRATRVAVLIVESIHLGIDLIDEQQPAIVEALVEYMEKQACEDKGSPRRSLRLCLLEYGKRALAEARTRESRLYYGITGHSSGDMNDYLLGGRNDTNGPDEDDPHGPDKDKPSGDACE
jgi:hypothetical protein